MSEPKRDFKGVLIPKAIWLSRDLSATEKLFWGEIDSLDNEDGCYASNGHFADMFGLSRGRCSKVISSLEEKGFITAEILRNEKNVIIRRILRIVQERAHPYSRKRPYPPSRKEPGGMVENDQGSITNYSKAEERDAGSAGADGKPSPQEALFPETEPPPPADPPKDRGSEPSPREIIFNLGVKLLTNQGTKESSARAFLGKWAGVDEDQLASVISQCALRAPMDARGYIVRAMKGGGKIVNIEQAKKAAIAENVPMRKGDTFEHLRDRIYEYRQRKLDEETEEQAETAS